MKHCDNLCCTKLTHLSVRDGQTVLLDDINLHLHCGELTSIIGPNGAGKSTLLKALIGERKFAGAIQFESETGVTVPVIGYVPQHLAFDPDSPATVADLFRACTGKKRDAARELLRVVEADGLLSRKLANLSGGELQRILLGLALAPVPNLLLLDEPISGVDQKGIERFWEILAGLRKQYDMTIIIVSHHLSQVRLYADRVVLLNKRVAASGTPDEVFASSAYRQLFGGDVL